METLAAARKRHAGEPWTAGRRGLLLGLLVVAALAGSSRVSSQEPAGPAGSESAKGQAVVHVYCQRLFGYLPRIALFCNGKEITTLGAGTVTELTLAPGRYTCYAGRDDRTATIEVGAGDVRYVRITPKRVAGWGPPRGTIETVASDLGAREAASFRRIAQDQAGAHPPGGSSERQPFHWSPFRGFVLYLPLLGIIAYATAVIASRRAARTEPDSAVIERFWVTLVKGLAVGFIPAVPLFGFLPVSLFVALLFFVGILAFVVALAIDGLDEAGSRPFWAHTGWAFLVCLYLGLLPAWALVRWFPGLAGGLPATSILAMLGVACVLAVDAGLNVFLASEFDASRDLSGAYEKSSRAHWVTRDGQHHMDAKKWQTGEWTPPVRTGVKLLWLNAGLVVLAAYLAYRWQPPTWMKGLLIYSGLLLIVSLVTALVRSRR